jgi:Trypsin-co-occurring domain 1
MCRLLTFAVYRANVPVTAVRVGRDLMKRLVEFPLEQGGSVVVEIDTPPAGPVVRGLGRDSPSLAERTDKTFEQATASVAPAARSLMKRMRSIEDPPDEIGIIFGVQLSAQSGAFIASVAAEANFTVSMTWRRGAAQS